jgi:hypothetical protein
MSAQSFSKFLFLWEYYTCATAEITLLDDGLEFMAEP